MTTPDLILANLLVLGLAAELFTLVDSEDGNTRSERFRAWLRLHSRPGRALFAVAWTSLAVCFLLRIL
ncbi:hypothetical protein [Streptomyces cavernae]|uniref:hypothetical protein n=1 Tax=Streptomyces cavernae TaxID=2259034 RepID=UPI000FEC1ACB|nr:hypothetical protein [Streptomyces cavernae]